MPLYEFNCEECHTVFEELIRVELDAPHCPKCGSIKVSRLVSAPGPLAKGAFPFKIFPPRPAAKKTGCGIGKNK